MTAFYESRRQTLEHWEEYQASCLMGLERAAQALGRLSINENQLSLFESFRNSYRVILPE